MTDTAGPADRRWQDFFRHPDYPTFAHATLPPERTAAETAAVRRILGLRPTTRVLDLGCGYGRISVPLARAGMEVTGLDAVPELLERARGAAAAAGVRLELIHSAMRDLDAVERFDAVVNLSTALGYVPDEADDAAALAAVYRALVPGGRLLIDTENREATLRKARRTWYEVAGATVWCRRSFAPMTGRWTETIDWLSDTGRGGSAFSLRLYALTELRSMLEGAGFLVEQAWGGLDQTPYECDSPRMVVLARRPA
ncbi:class I SAM-dependent methyltransferase [Nocardiopsis rhodophaea]|uniref:class I SAM-dependent methyltransferase n=1 Tax=Nocardiopsis rhodophaea TaxID=280238 RepID=UPI0031D4C990